MALIDSQKTPSAHAALPMVPKAISSPWLLFVSGVVIAPVVEEVFFRGFLFPAFEERLGLGTGNQDLRPSQVNGKVHRGGKTEDMEIGQRPQHDLFGS